MEIIKWPDIERKIVFKLNSSHYSHRPATCADELRPFGAFEIFLQFKNEAPNSRRNFNLIK
jgi:hypothetical protein